MSRYRFPRAPLRLTKPYSSLVIKTLDEILPKDPKRRCFRLIGGVLVERTVEDVAPNLKTNLEGVSCLLSPFLPYLTI
jgi:Prefoldin subunit